MYLSKGTFSEVPPQFTVIEAGALDSGSTWVITKCHSSELHSWSVKALAEIDWVANTSVTAEGIKESNEEILKIPAATVIAKMKSKRLFFIKKLSKESIGL